MFTIKRKLYSRHTPDNLEKYKDLSEEEIKKMTRGQKLQYLEDEYEKAGRNESRYIAKKAKKWGLAGALAGASAGYALGKGSGALAGGLYGGVAGFGFGGLRGSSKAKKEGHDQEKISLKKSRKLDEVARKMKQDDDYEIYTKGMIRGKNTERDAKQARNLALLAAINS